MEEVEERNSQNIANTMGVHERTLTAVTQIVLQVVLQRHLILPVPRAATAINSSSKSELGI